VPFVERSVLGYCYASVGAGYARMWQFPKPIVDAIEHQYAPFENNVYEPLAGVIHLAAWRARGKEARLNDKGLAVTYPDAVGVALGLNVDMVLQQDPILTGQPIPDWNMRSACDFMRARWPARLGGPRPATSTCRHHSRCRRWPQGVDSGRDGPFFVRRMAAAADQAVDLVGASIGAWRMATACLDNPVAAFERLEHDYIHQHYELAPGQKSGDGGPGERNFRPQPAIVLRRAYCRGARTTRATGCTS